MKTLSKTQQQKTQRETSKHKHLQPKGKAIAANAVETEEELQSGYDSYYQQLSEEVETIERHVRELRQTPGLEHLSEAGAQVQVDFMLRFSAWVFNQHIAQQLIGTIDDEADLMPRLAKVSKVQKPKGVSNKKVTESLSL